MKKLLCLCLALMLFALPALAEKYVPTSSGKLPDRLSYPDSPVLLRVQREGDAVTLTLDRELPEESLVTALGRDPDCLLFSVNLMPVEGETMVYTAAGLPEGGWWTGFEVAWVKDGVNAVARYNEAGDREITTRFDSKYNEYIFDNDGRFVEFVYADSGVRAVFDTRGRLVRYGYEAARNTVVWFTVGGEMLYAEYNNGEFAATWQQNAGWFVDTPAGRVKAKLNVGIGGAKPLLEPEEEEPGEEEKEPEFSNYPNNTIVVAGLTLQEVSERLPDKWYNVLPVDLTQEGRQTYFLIISGINYIGRLYVDVWDGEVTVRTALIDHPDITPKSSYGRWFTSLSQITASSIESTENGFVFGEPVSIEEDLGGAEVALLFIRSKASYRTPFRDGSSLARYWRNTDDWKEFRVGLQELVQRVAK